MRVANFYLAKTDEIMAKALVFTFISKYIENSTVCLDTSIMSQRNGGDSVNNEATR